jgi:homoserine kinase type II
MSVFTTVSPEQLRPWLQSYPLGALLELEGIAAGITNTNYFVTTETGRYVLTLFEHNTPEELPYYLNLMAHLAERGIPCPHPVANASGSYLDMLNGKPAALVSCLRGSSVESPDARQCAAMGSTLARMHLAGQSFPFVMENPRGSGWRTETAARIAPMMAPDQREMLEREIDFLCGSSFLELPHGMIHADMFRDNVLFEAERLTGLIDFYYACNDALAYDLAITVNDWCVDAGGNLDTVRLLAILRAYHAVRPLTEAEHRAWPGLLRAAAMRFWLSRLHDLHYPQPGKMTYAKDPEHFRRILAARIRDNDELQAQWV